MIRAHQPSGHMGGDEPDKGDDAVKGRGQSHAQGRRHHPMTRIFATFTPSPLAASPSEDRTLKSQRRAARKTDIRMTATARRAISCQLERETSPKVQKTTMASSVSVARYWTKMVAEVNRDDRATPERIIASGERRLSPARIRMTTVADMAPPKAKAVAQKAWAPKATMLRAAPKAAPG